MAINTSKSLTDKLRGILLPFTTPFKQNEELDGAALRANIRRWNATGVSGYVALGSTGERVHLDERDYLEVIETARAEVPGELAFIVGAGQQSTRGTIEEIKKAAKVGADAALVITPSFYRAAVTPSALVTHYLAVADASPVPVILYSMPALTGIRIEPSTVARLSEHPNIFGLKDSSAHLEGFKETVQLAKEGRAVEAEGFAVLTGNGTVLHEALEAGADGAILAVGCALPQLCIAIMNAFNSDNSAVARSLQQKLTPLARAVTTEFGIGGLKAAMDMVGLVGGSVRAPLRAPDDEARREIRRCLDEADKALSEFSAPKAGASH